VLDVTIQVLVKDAAHKIQPALPLHSPRQHSSQSTSNIYFLPSLSLDRRGAAWRFLHIPEGKGQVPFAEQTNPLTVRYQEHTYFLLGGALVNGMQGLTLYMRCMLLLLLVLYFIKPRRITLALLSCI
jgi:hypothetical protein